jgi:hypothetical protein
MVHERSDSRSFPGPSHQPEWHAPNARPASRRAIGIAKQQLSGDPAVEQECLATAQRSHHRRHLRGGEPEWNSPQRGAERIEAGERDDDAAVIQGTERQPCVPMLEVEDEEPSVSPRLDGSGQALCGSIFCMAGSARGHSPGSRYIM